MSVEPVPKIGRGRCGCASTDCTCRVVGTGTITVVGSGNEGDPMQFMSDVQVALQVLDTTMIDLTLTGSGTPEDPYILSGVTDSTASDSVIFLASVSAYQYTIIPAYRALAVTAIGGGGGGGYGDDGPNAIGGGGGRGGAITQIFSDLPPSVTGWDLSIDVGLGGTGGVNGAALPNRGGDSRVRRRVQGSGGAYTLVALSHGGDPGFPGDNSGGQTPNTQVQIGSVRGGDGKWGSGVQPSADTAWAPGGGGSGAGLGTNVRALTPGGVPRVRGSASQLRGGNGSPTGGSPGETAVIGGGGGGGGAAVTTPTGNGGSGGSGLVMIVVW